MNLKLFYNYDIRFPITGEQNGDCSQLSPDCTPTEQDLLQAVEDLGIIEPHRVRRDVYSSYPKYPQEYAPNSSWRKPSQPFRPPTALGFTPNRRQSFLSNLPPLFRPEEIKARGTCKTCDARGTVCTVYGVGEISA